MAPRVLAVHRGSSHSFSKYAQEAITLVEALGVAGDAHAGAVVLRGGEIRPGDTIVVHLPPAPHQALQPV